jgi:hypothetical protein
MFILSLRVAIAVSNFPSPEEGHDLRVMIYELSFWRSGHLFSDTHFYPFFYQCNFLITQFICLVAAFGYRKFLHPSKVSPESRLLAALSLGLFLSYFCFGM